MRIVEGSPASASRGPASFLAPSLGSSSSVREYDDTSSSPSSPETIFSLLERVERRKVREPSKGPCPRDSRGGVEVRIDPNVSICRRASAARAAGRSASGLIWRRHRKTLEEAATASTWGALSGTGAGGAGALGAGALPERISAARRATCAI